nr:cysteine desulfurase-like protein [Brevibacillus parabrevis]
MQTGKGTKPVTRTSAFPVQEIREQFPALQRTYHAKLVAYLDGPGGSQVVAASMQAIFRYMENGGANLHGAFPTSRETEAIIADARQAVADLLDAAPEEVAFGANMTTLAFAIARALSRFWQPGDEIILSELDHRANVDPWLTAALDRGVLVRWLKADPETLTLATEELDTLLTEKTRLVAVGLASNAVGTINDVARIARAARRVGAVVAVDAVHAAPHMAISCKQLGADILLCSAYKFFGPHVGMAVIRQSLFESLKTYKLAPAPGYIPDKLETGTQNHEGIAGIAPAIDFIASLGTGANRRERLADAFSRLEKYENHLADVLRSELQQTAGVKLFQAGVHVPKTPTIAFRLEGIDPEEACLRMAEEHSVFIASGDFYASRLAELAGLADKGGWIRAGIAPYNTEEEIRRLAQGIAQMVRARKEV